MKRENQLLENKQMREEVVGRIEVLEQVGELLLLTNTEFATTEMVAGYYEVAIETIKSLVFDNKDELIGNGYRVVEKEELSSLKNLSQLKTRAKSLALFSKRAILNVGMLLRDSKVAIELRSRLLDVIHDSEQGQGNIETVINEISEEKQLMLQRIEAEMSGNFDEVCVINAKLEFLN